MCRRAFPPLVNKTYRRALYFFSFIPERLGRYLPPSSPSLPLTRQPHPLISRVIFSPASPSDCSSPTDNRLLSVSHPWNVLYLVICHNLTPSPHRFCLPCFLVPPFLSLIPSTLDLLTPSLKMNVCVCHVSLENAAGDER